MASPASPLPIDSYSRHIPVEDARLLRRFFGDSEQGGIYAGFSAFGAQLDRASRMAFGSRTCPKCRGAGWLPKRKKVPNAIDIALREFQLKRKEVAIPQAMECWCPSCGGRGIVPKRSRSAGRKPVTARPTGSSLRPLEGGSITSDQEAAEIADAGRAMNRLAAVEALQPGARVVLSLYYARDSGGELALWRLTPAGQTMVRTNPRELPPDALFANLREAQSRQDIEDAREHGEDARKSRRKALLEAAADQAAELIGRAHQAWNACAPQKTKREPRKERVRAPKESWVAELEASLSKLLGAA